MKYSVLILIFFFSLNAFAQENKVRLQLEITDSIPIVYEVIENNKTFNVYFNRNEVLNYLENQIKNFRQYEYSSFINYLKNATDTVRFSQQYSSKTHGQTDFTRYNLAMYSVTHDLLEKGECMVVSKNKVLDTVRIKYCDGFFGTTYTEFYNNKGKLLFSIVTALGE